MALLTNADMRSIAFKANRDLDGMHGDPSKLASWTRRATALKRSVR